MPTDDERTFHARMLVLAQSSADVLSRYHFEPGHFTASGFVVKTDPSRLLLVFHERLGRWLQPGGHVEPEDRDIAAGARREIAEEAGLTGLAQLGTGLFDIDVHEIPAARGEPHHEHHDLRFLFAANRDDAQEDGDLELRWVPLNEVPEHTNDRSVRRAVRKLTSRS